MIANSECALRTASKLRNGEHLIVMIVIIQSEL
jgi:hypothetical protein